MALPVFAEKINKHRKLLLYFCIPFISLIMHLHVFNRDIVGYHAWRQTQTQTNIENFANEDFNIVNPRVNNKGNESSINRMEFPVMQWLFACFYKLFGNHVIISRILSFIIGLFSIWGVYHLLMAIFNRVTVAMIGAWCFTFSPVFYYYIVNPMPDNFALCLAIWGMCYFFRWIKGEKSSHLIASAALLSMATMTKLPFVIYLAAIGAYAIYGWIRKTIKAKSALDILVIFFFCFLPPAAWYFSVVGTWQSNGIVSGVFSVKKEQLASIPDIMQFNLFSALPEMLINYGSLLFFLAAGWFIYKNKTYKKPMFPVFMWWGIACLLYFVFEMNMIARVHDYYLFPFLPLLFILVAYGAEQLLSIKLSKLKPVFVLALCILPITAFVRINHRWSTIEPGFNPDLYTYKTELRNAVPNNALCVAGNDESGNIIFYYIHKKGWNFDQDTLTKKGLVILIDRGARYLYTDSRKVDEDAGIVKCLDKLVLQKGSFKVYSLKAGMLIQ